MIDATDSSMSHTESDPTLSSLVPQRSRGRNVVLIGFVFLGVIGLWASHGVLRPTVVSDSGGGATWTALPTHDQVATVVLLDPSGWSRIFSR